MTIRRKTRNEVTLYNESLLVEPHRPFWFALQCLLHGTGRDRAMLVYRDRSVGATVQSQGRSGRPEQDITWLSVSGYNADGMPSDHDVWFRLLERLCISAGLNNVQRLYVATWRERSEIREIFRQLGFQAYTHRYILQLCGPDWDQGTKLSPMRTQSRQDAWAIHKLYGCITPHLVQHAEFRTPRDWMLPLTKRWNISQQKGWVLGSSDEMQAYLHMMSGPASHVLNVLIHPDARDIVTDVLRFGLSQILDSRPVYLLLREYHQELLKPLQGLGFEMMSEQTLLVKSMGVPIRRTMFLPAFEAQPWDTQVPIPSISVSRGDSHSYVRATRRNK